MNSFSPTEAALEGFRLARENPLAVAIWALLQFAVSLISTVLLIQAAGPQLAAMMQMATAAGAAVTPDQQVARSQEMLNMFSQFGLKILPIYPVLIPLTVILRATQSAAVMRVILR